MEAGWSGGLMASAFTHGIAIPHIIQNGSKELIDTYVRPVLAGDMIGSLGITEPGAGSDVASITTRAVRDGDHYVINGAKTFITSSVRGDFVTTAVRTADTGAHGISMIVVPHGTPGFTVSRKLDKMGWLASDTGELSYDDVRVPVANLVGQENHGFYYIAQNFVSERIWLALLGYGAASTSPRSTPRTGPRSASRSAPIKWCGRSSSRCTARWPSRAATHSRSPAVTTPARTSSPKPAWPSRPRSTRPSGSPIKRSSCTAVWATCVSRRSNATTATSACSRSVAVPPKS